MTRNRMIALSSILLIASGGLIFACSGDDSGTDGGADAKADQTSNKDGGSDAAKDGSIFPDAGKDATVQDSGNDATVEDATTDATETDASDDGASSDAGAVSTFIVVRVGGDMDAGADASLSSASTQVFLEERNLSDGSLVRTIAMPTAVNGQNQPFTVSGTATSEGDITTSVDGHTVVLAGYAAAPGVTKVNATSVDGGTLRVVARVDKNGNVDTTTRLFAFDQSNSRSAATVDGTNFWASGTSATIDAGQAGVQYVTLGSAGGTTDLFDYNVRMVGIFGGQVYVASQLPPYNGISKVGTGMPTTANQTVTLLPGFPDGDGGSSPNSFTMLQLDGSVGAVDTLYIADETGQSSGGGIQKWVFNGTTWTKVATFKNGATTGFRGVMAIPSGSDVIVLGTTSSSNGNSVIKYVDDGSNTNPTGATIATAGANTVFRGVAIAPQ